MSDQGEHGSQGWMGQDPFDLWTSDFGLNIKRGLLNRPGPRPDRHPRACRAEDTEGANPRIHGASPIYPSRKGRGPMPA